MPSAITPRDALEVVRIACACCESGPSVFQQDEALAVLTTLVEQAGEPVAEPMYGEIAAPQDALYEQAAAMDNQDVPLEEWPDKLIGALARSGYAVVPCSLPPVVLGEAYISGAFDAGNPKHGWDYLLSKVRAYPRFNTAPGASHER